MKKIKLVVTGATGRMGTRIMALAEADPRFQLMAGVDRPGGQAVGRFTARKAPVVGNLNEVLVNADVVIDFTSPEGAMKNAVAAAKMKRALVIGTTGLSAADMAKLKEIARKVPVVFSPNMSVGVNVLFDLVKEAVSKLTGYDIEIVEAHHNQKKDSPSGTAKRLAEIAAKASKRSSKDFVYGRQGQVGARSKKEIGILALRAGDIVGDHTVLISNTGERLELTHRAHSRDAFASGALSAAAWIVGKRPGFYSMLDVLKGR